MRPRKVRCLHNIMFWCHSVSTLLRGDGYYDVLPRSPLMNEGIISLATGSINRRMLLAPCSLWRLLWLKRYVLPKVMPTYMGSLHLKIGQCGGLKARLPYLNVKQLRSPFQLQNSSTNEWRPSLDVYCNKTSL